MLSCPRCQSLARVPYYLQRAELRTGRELVGWWVCAACEFPIQAIAEGSDTA